MKRVLSVLLACILCFSLMACDDETGFFSELYSYTFGGKNPWDQEESGTQQNTADSYRIPIILLHGRISNTSKFFGVETQIGEDNNSHYRANVSLNNKPYASPASHQIINVQDGKLGAYLKALGYEENKNLFAFNYPNQDMVKINALKLRDYIEKLIEWAQSDSHSDIVDSNKLFATQQDKKDGKVKFILIGHSMGGLVSRYYVENMTDKYVEKIITIDTPHYGSDLGTLSDLDPTTRFFCPCDVDLQPNSQLFGRGTDGALSDFNEKESYAYLNQSPALQGNHDTDVKYYAIGGFDVGTVYSRNGELNNKYLRNLSSEMLEQLDRGAAVLITFNVDATSEEAFENGINEKLNALSLSKLGESSHLLSGFSDGGDEVVDCKSQFAVRFGKHAEHQKIENATLIISSKIGLYHNEIAKENVLYDAVRNYLEIEDILAKGN